MLLRHMRQEHQLLEASVKTISLQTKEKEIQLSQKGLYKDQEMVRVID